MEGESSKSAESRGLEGSANGTVKKSIEQELNNIAANQLEMKDAEDKKEAEAERIEERKSSPLRGRGMHLNYVPPTLKQGTPTAKLVVDEIVNEVEKWRHAVILYVIGEPPTITYLRSFLQSQCMISGHLEIYYHNDGYILVKCESGSEKEKLLFDGPYMIGGRPVIINDWRADLCFAEEVLTEIPLWIHLPNLPLSYWSGDSLSRVGSVIRRPICADECTTQQSRISYARMLIEVDITKPLKYKVNIEGEDGKEILQQVYYEWAPAFCQRCQKLGHICKEKPVVQKHWVPKDKGKEKVEDEEANSGWEKPKYVASSSIQVGNIEISTENVFQQFEDMSIHKNGGDEFPKDDT